ncbi:helix-turn-helix transcriptional regulator [Streptomyces sp. DH-12]|uniref:LuxR C-terminal-related transcriptional regulator n=1 Tax=unclassified Streptomyces TaxID=2593676 RepID=UPI000CCDE515|nr:LuxR C-terminal-related transcriptional regulator [Streptomyces sp. DH-12]PNV33588.1 helix-turn-helix transcriptional regulator [Streptomyces sp. DH-12]
MTGTPHAEHGPDDLCPAGTGLYEKALREGRLDADEAEAAPCAVDLGLLRPAADDLSRLEPLPPAVALQRLLRHSGERIAAERRREEWLAETFHSLMRTGDAPAGEASAPTLCLLSGLDRINGAIARALAEGTREVLCIQPPNSYQTSEYARTAQAAAMVRDQQFLDRGGRIRVIYPHTQRHIPLVVARYERLRGDAQARTMDEVTGRMIIVDQAVAFIPGAEEGHSDIALEIRHPAVIAYLVSVFDRLWRLATPMHPQTVQPPSLGGVTARQRAIARLLVEGHTDAVIADRLGMNIRTARVHIAKLAATLGSGSRAQLGYLIARSGILDREG